MSTAIPQSMTFEMLSRLPSNSFVLLWKEYRPDVTPLNNEYLIGGAGAVSQRIRFNLRGAPNEFALNTNISLCGTVYGATRQVAATAANNIYDTDDKKRSLYTSGAWGLNSPYHYFSSSRESFNSGSLPYLDNQDLRRSHIHNNLRYASARRNRSLSGASIGDIGSSFDASQNRLFSSASGTFGPGVSTAVGTAATSGGDLEYSRDIVPLRISYGVTTGPSNYEKRSLGKNKTFQIPLGLYSNMINSHSLVPLGLMSSYSVNGYQIELDTNAQTGAIGQVFRSQADPGTLVGSPQFSIPIWRMRDVRVYIPIIRVLDPAVMEAVLSLYEKRETVNVGGVQFPLSLRMNTMAYRFSSFPIIQNQSDYHFRIAGTDRSVRGVAFWIYRTADADAGTWVLGGDDAGLANSNNIKVTRLETRIGTEHVHEVVEDVSTNTDNVSNFLNVNSRKSGALWSPLPYYKEGALFEGQQDDDLSQYNMAMSCYRVNATNSAAGNQVIPFSTVQSYAHSRGALAYGHLSFENLDRREGDHSGSFQASGKDLTNVGAIEIDMRVQQTVEDATLNVATVNPSTDQLLNSFFQYTPPGAGYEIVFMYAYDSVYEVSPQGVQDITNAVL